MVHRQRQRRNVSLLANGLELNPHDRRVARHTRYRQGIELDLPGSVVEVAAATVESVPPSVVEGAGDRLHHRRVVAQHQRGRAQPQRRLLRVNDGGDRDRDSFADRNLVGSIAHAQDDLWGSDWRCDINPARGGLIQQRLGGCAGEIGDCQRQVGLIPHSGPVHRLEGQLEQGRIAGESV